VSYRTGPPDGRLLAGVSFSIAEEDFRDLVSADTRAGNARMIGQEKETAVACR
jgi:hypothetical protein